MVTHSAVSVVNGIVTGKGVTIGIDIPCRVIARLERRPKTRLEANEPDPHNLINTSLDYCLSYLGIKQDDRNGITLKIESEIPPAVGLKSSSAVSVAVVKAVFGLFSKRLRTSGERETENAQILEISCKASKASGASITGAYDDAAASLLGGLIFADNSRFKLIRKEKTPKNLGSIVRVLVPLREKKLTSSIDRSIYSKHLDRSEDAYQNALRGEIAQAMLQNSIVQCLALGYSILPVTSALCEGASASGISGKGPAVSAICKSEEIARRVEKRWLDENPRRRVIRAKTDGGSVAR